MEIEPTLVKLSAGSGSLTEQSYFRLKREIIELERPPGDQFTEYQVATSLGISKTPVREALARLHRDGLVVPVPRAGYVVSSITLSDVEDLCDMRTLLTSEAAFLAAERGLSSPCMDRLIDLCNDANFGQLAGPHLSERLRGNYEFESIIANGSQNKRLALSVASVFDEIERCARLAVLISPEMPPSRIDERKSIVDALIARDPVGARNAMRNRTQSARKEIVEALAASPEVMSTAIPIPKAHAGNHL